MTDSLARDGFGESEVDVERTTPEDQTERTDDSPPPTIKDVARMAGVSLATVSRVLNSEPHVREETRLRVVRAVAVLSYRRNEAAAALRRGRRS